MPIGPGKFDDQCTRVLLEEKAGLVIVAVLGGARGHGFSVATVNPALVQGVPQMLREIADGIESELKANAS